MGVDTTIKIPIWAEFSKITEVINKIMGNSYQIVPLDKKIKSIDKNKPSSKNNEWIMLFNRPVQMTTDDLYFSQNCPLVELKFKDNNNMGVLYNLNFHLEPQRDEQNGKYYYCITARCKPEIIFIGKKLVDFFGGKVIYTDTNSDHDEDNFYFREKGFFKNYSSEDKLINDKRFFRYYNALKNFPLATEKELDEIAKNFMVTDRFISLRKGLSIARNKELKNKINNKIDESKIKNRTKNNKNKMF